MRTHEENRAIVCCICWQKSNQTISTKLCSIIRQNVIANYDPNSPLFPGGLCSSCRAALYSVARNERKRHLNVAESFVPGLTGSKRSGGTGWCRICSIARIKGPRGVVSKKKTSSRVSAAAHPAELNVFSKSFAIFGNGELLPKHGVYTFNVYIVGQNPFGYCRFFGSSFRTKPRTPKPDSQLLFDLAFYRPL